MDCKAALHDIHGGAVLDEDSAAALVADMLREGLEPVAAAGVLAALATRGEAVSEIVGGARALRGQMRRVELPQAQLGRAIDTCGTGGTGRRLFNCSTLSAVAIAAAGGLVVKHGNRSVHSPSGSADFLEAAGVDLAAVELPWEQALERFGFCFLFAQTHHPAMRHIAPVRRALAIPTLLNLLGPLCNPAGVRRQVLGVAFDARRPQLAQALAALDCQRALVVHSGDHLDEISLLATTEITEVHAGQVAGTWTLDPRRHARGSGASAEDLAVSGAEESVALGRRVLQGEACPAADMVALNAAAGLYVAGDDTGEDAYAAAVQRAYAALQSGKGAELLAGYAAWTCEGASAS